MKKPNVMLCTAAYLLLGAIAALPPRCFASPVVPAKAPATLLQKLQAGQLTVGALVDGLGSPSEQERRQAAEAIVALREHYLAGAEGALETAQKRQLSPEVSATALRELAFLRPSNPTITGNAGRNLALQWIPLGAGLGRRLDSYPATRLMVSASLAALPPLLDLIATEPVPPGETIPAGQDMALLCAMSILGPATGPWLDQEAAVSPKPARQDALRQVSQWLAAHSTPAPDNDLAPALRWFASAHALDDGFDQTTLQDIPLNGYKVQWNVTAALTDLKKVGDGYPHSFYAAEKMNRTMELLTYGIAEKLILDDHERDLKFSLYPAEAQTDAVRVLGTLRPIVGFMGPWVLWQRLRAKAAIEPLDEDRSPETAVTLRALGQMDIPAARMLVGRILAASSETDQRAASYILGRIMGHYAPYFLQAEIAKLQIAGDKSQVRQQLDVEQIQKLQTVLQWGREKRWFEGEYYGHADLSAYRLMMPS